MIPFCWVYEFSLQAEGTGFDAQIVQELFLCLETNNILHYQI